MGDTPLKVHGCCGCACHICANGHNTGWGVHTDPCRTRFFAEWESTQQENVEEPK